MKSFKINHWLCDVCCNRFVAQAAMVLFMPPHEVFAGAFSSVPPATVLTSATRIVADKSLVPPAGVHWLDPKIYARTVDSLSDVKPVTRTMIRASARIDAVTLDMGTPSELFTIRSGKSAVEMCSKDSKGNDITLGAFRWDGPTLQWSWNRVIATTNAKALEALDRALLTATLRMDLVGGKQEFIYLPPALVTMAIAPDSTKRIPIATPAGQVLVIGAVADLVWTPSDYEAPVGTVALVSDAGEIQISWDSATSECVVQWIAQGVRELDALRAEIAERRKESSKRSPAERRIIDMEIAGLESRLTEFQAAARMRDVQIADFPLMTMTGGSGRVFAKIDLVTKQKASK